MQTIPSRKFFLLLSFSFLLIISATVSEAGPPDVWYHRMLPLYGVTYGQDLLVGVGDWGTILTSRDGRDWRAPGKYATFKNLRGVAFGAGLFVAVGEDGEIITSPDGFQWTSRVSPVTELLWGITYGNGLYVAVGSMGTIVTSPNGVDWTRQNSKVSEFLYGAAFGNGRFVAVGNSGRILTSTDGLDWDPQQVTSYELRGVAFGDNSFRAVGLGGIILSSDTGLSWTQTSLGVQNFFYGIAYTNGMFTAVGENIGSHTGIIAYYFNNSWAISTGPSHPLNGVGSGNSLAVAVGDRGLIFRYQGWSHHNMPIWSPINDVTTSYLNAVFLCKDKLVAAGNGVILESLNGVIWDVEYGTTVNLWAIASNGTTCVVVGDGGNIIINPYGWVATPSNTSDWLFAVTFGSNGKFVVMGASGYAYTSPNGTTWEKHPLGAFYVVTGVTFGNDKFVAVGWGGGVLSSPDGEYWNFTPSGVAQNLNAIAFGKGIFVAVGDTGVILTSVNGTTWTPAAVFPSVNNLYSVAFAGDSFFAVGAQGTIIFSEDGTHWSLHHSWTTKDLHGAGWAGSYGIAVGAEATFLQSGFNAKLFMPLLLRN
jgi:photosystem II stability/assembly factor-like uncharacterized protein